MQPIPVDNEILKAMPEKPIDLQYLSRLEQDFNRRLETIERNIKGVELGLAELRGEITGLSKPRSDVHWSIRNVLAPLIVAIIMLLASTLAGFAYHDLDKRLSSIESFLRDNGGYLAGLRLENVSPSNPETVQEVEQIFVEAKKAKVTIPRDVIEKTGQKFIDVANNNNPSAWNAALAFLEYRTYLNSNITPFPVKATGEPTKYVYALNSKPNPDAKQQSPTVVAFHVTQIPGNVLPQDSARIEMLNNPQPPNSGVKYLIIDGGADIIDLDGQYLKNVVVRNAIVEYDGGPVRLENVFFVNCTLRWRSSAPARELGQKLLADSAVDFKFPATLKPTS